MAFQRVADRARHTPGDVGERGVQYGRVLAFEQAEGADLGAERDRDVAELFADDLLGLALVLVGYGGEDARDRDRLRSAGHLAGEPRDRVLVERRELAPVELDPALDDQLARRDHRAQVLGPAEQRPDRLRRRAADAQHADAPKTSSLEDGVRRVRRPEHRVRDPAPVDALDDAGDRALDAGRHVGGRRHLRLREEAVVGVEHDGVRVRPAHVHAEAKVRRGHAGPPPAHSRGRSRSAAAPRARGRAPSARSDRTGTRSRSPAARTGGARSRSRSRTASRAP